VAEKKEEEGFKVVDRRLFTEEGDLRTGVIEQERRDEEAAAARAEAVSKANAAAAAKAPGPAGGASPDAGTLGVPGQQNGQTGADAIPASRSFQMLVDFLTRNAAAMLGGMADPQTGQPYVDLEGAHEVIDMLDALREKTQGNLARADNDLITEVVGSLKLTFLEISKAAAAAEAKKATQKK
jgi:hypothetical protein